MEDRLLAELADLTAAELAELLEDLPPIIARRLPELIPPDPRRVDAAREATADGLAWLRWRLPELVPLEPGPHHRALIDALPPDGPRGVRVAAGAPRGSGKSTMLLLGGFTLAAVRNSHRFAVVLRANSTDATSVTLSLRAIFERLADDYPWVRPTNRDDSELHLESGMVIVARGAGAAIRGLHRIGPRGEVIRPSLVAADDIETDESARSELQVGRLSEWVLGTLGQLGGPPGEAATQPLDLYVIGTTLEQGALLSRMLAGLEAFASWTRLRFPAEARIDRDPEGGLRTVDAEGAPVPIPVPAGAEAGDRIAMWPTGQPLAYLDSLQDPTSEVFVGSRIYAREYLLRPIAAGDILFPRAHTRWVDGLAQRWTARDLPALERGAVGVDPAASTKDAADYTALVVTGLWRPEDADAPRRLAVPYAQRRKLTLAQLLEWAEEVADLYQARVVFESQGGFAWGAQELRRRGRVAVRAVAVGSDKRARAEPLTLWHEAGRIDVDATLRHSAFDDEWHSFTGDKDLHDDQVDALVHAAAYSTSAWRLR